MECFDYSCNLNVICTGGVDHAVRLWNPYVTAKPVAIMKGHQASIIDLVIHEALEQVFGYDKDGVRFSFHFEVDQLRTSKRKMYLPFYLVYLGGRDISFSEVSFR